METGGVTVNSFDDAVPLLGGAEQEPESTNKCPLCGGDNQCAMAEGKPASDCWCQSVTIASEVLTRIPESQYGQTCICAGCNSRLGQAKSGDDDGHANIPIPHNLA